MQSDFDMLIIGGGMVGASLACALGNLSLRVGVIEAISPAMPSQPSYDDRTVALAYGSKRIFEGIGVWNRIDRESAAPIEQIHISDRNRFGFTRLNAADLGAPALGYVLENRVLGVALYAAMSALKNVELFCPASMRALRIERDCAYVDVFCEDRLRQISAKLIVAADGADSAVRDSVGIPAAHSEYRQCAIIANVTPQKPHGNTAYERFTESGPLALLPMTKDRCAMVWTARAADVETILAWNDSEFLARLQDRFGERLGVFQRIGKRKAYPLSLTRVKEHVRPRAALVGNAAHAVHPVAGQGFNLGLRDVAALAEVVIDAVRRGDDIGELPVLRAYADWRARDIRVISAFTDGLARIFASSFAPLRLVRDIGLTAVNILPPVKRGLVRMTSGLTGRLPRLARGLPL